MIYKIKDASGLINIKHKYPNMKKIRLNIDINKFVKKTDFVFLNIK